MRRSAASSGRGSRRRAACRTCADARSALRRRAPCPLSSPDHLLYRSSPHDDGLERGDAKSSAEHRLRWASTLRLPAVLGDWAWLCRNGLPFLQLFENTPSLRRVDVDAGAHRARERNLPDVAALGGRGPPRHDPLPYPPL